MTMIVDLGHLGAGPLGIIGALSGAKGARVYFYVLGVWYLIDVAVYFLSHLGHISLKTNILVNGPHILIFIAAFWIAAKVSRNTAAA